MLAAKLSLHRSFSSSRGCFLGSDQGQPESLAAVLSVRTALRIPVNANHWDEAERLGHL